MQTCAPVTRPDDSMAEIETLCRGLCAELARPFAQRQGFARLLARLDQILQDLRPLVARQERALRITRDPANPAAHREARRLRLMRQSVRELVRLSDLLAQIAAGVQRPLYPDPLPRHDLHATQIAMLDHALLALHRLTNPASQSAEAAELGCFPDIALRPSLFVAHAHAAYRVALAMGKHADVRFLDVGCGSGMKVLAAADFFATVEGLDFDPAYVDAATALFDAVGARQCRVFEANGLTFTGYDSYDVIYFYRPMKEHAGLAALEEQIVRHARPGTILIAPYSTFVLRAGTLDFAHVAGDIHVAGISPAGAQTLHHLAQRIGPVLPRKVGYSGPPVDWLRALWLACARQGYVAE